MGVLFVANLVLQVVSLVRLIKFLTKNKWARASLVLFTLAFSLLYLNDVLLMVTPQWGIPAYRMTFPSYDIGKRRYINSYRFCLYDYYDRDGYEKQH